MSEVYRAALVGVGLSVFGLLLALALRPKPALRVTALSFVAALLILSPAIPLLSSNFGLGRLPLPGTPALAPEAPTPGAVTQEPGTSAPAPEQAATTPTPGGTPAAASTTPAPPTTPTDWPAWAAWAWAAGAIIGLAHLLLGLIAATRVVKRAKASSDPVQLLCQRLAANIGVRNSRVRISAEVEAPSAIGLWHKVILVPESLTESDDLEPVLMHELSHLKHKHSSHALFMAVARATQWWNPFAWWLEHEQRHAMEEAADDEALMAGTDAKRLAETVVAWATKTTRLSPVELSISISSNPKGLELRLKRLLRNGGTKMTRTSTLAIAAVAAVTLSAAALATVLQPAPDPDAAGDYLPFAEGAKWQYTGGGKNGYTMTAWSLQETTAGPIWEVRTHEHSYSAYSYWSDRDGRIASYGNSMLGGMPGVRPDDSTTILKLPPKQGETWSWTYIAPFQTAGDGEVDPEQFRVNATATVESMNESVTVPAGTFSAVRVRHDRKARFGDSSTTYWFAKGVGMVKRVETGGSGTNTYELASFTPGSSVSHEEAARRFARENQALAGFSAPTEVKFDRSGFRSRFFTMKKVDDVRLIRTFGGKGYAFDPREADAWNLLVSQEQPGSETGSSIRRPSFLLGPLYVPTLWHVLGLSGPYDASSSEHTMNADGTSTFKTSAKGTQKTLELTVYYKDELVTNVEFAVR